MTEYDTNALLWHIIQSDEQKIRSLITEERQTQFIDSFYMPDKGYGQIQVDESDYEKALDVLEKYVGEFEWDYYPTGFITTKEIDDCFYYGKFEIEDIPSLLRKFMEEEVRIKNIMLIETGFKDSLCW